MSDHRKIAYSLPLDRIDVSNPDLYQQDVWRPYFERLRAEDPVHFCANSRFGPFWSITRFDDCIKVDKDHHNYSAEPVITIGDPVPTDRPPPDMFIQMDPPRHDQRRNTVQPAVAPRNLRNLEPLIRERVVQILDELPVGETFDWVENVGVNLTSRMLATLFDFPQDERRKLIYWSDVFTDDPRTGASRYTAQERSDAVRDCMQTFTRLFAQRSAMPPGEDIDLLSMLAHGPATQDLMDRPEELLGTLILLIVGGNDTTRNSISGGVMALNDFPDEYAKLRADPGLITSMVPEIVRWQSPVLHIRRTMSNDCDLNGKQLAKGDKVIMWYISGNRDESAIERADDFVIDRKNPRHHLSFGFGIHRCMGNRLAEMQLTVLWEEIVKRFSQVEVVGPAERLGSNLIRGITHLPVRLHA
ncbi:MAG: cytochrome P450 [Proteobacteria bacterium]|nr:cytochrome P450 [Pseudomonadota bacterium]